MKLGVLLLCRYSSSRLPGKIMEPIEGKPLIWHIHERLSKVLANEQIIITTSEHPSDDRIQEYCELQGWPCFRGSLDRVAQRFLDAATHFKLDYAVRINGDNLFVDLAAFRDMRELALSQELDFVSNVKGRSFPYGMSIEILRTAFYRELMPQLNTDYYQEHVTIYLYENEDIGNRAYFLNEQCPEASGLKLAVDYPEDLEKMKKIMAVLKEKSYEYDLQSLTQLIKETKA